MLKISQSSLYSFITYTYSCSPTPITREISPSEEILSLKGPLVFSGLPGEHVRSSSLVSFGPSFLWPVLWRRIARTYSGNDYQICCNGHESRAGRLFTVSIYIDRQVFESAVMGFYAGFHGCQSFMTLVSNVCFLSFCRLASLPHGLYVSRLFTLPNFCYFSNMLICCVPHVYWLSRLSHHSKMCFCPLCQQFSKKNFYARKRPIFKASGVFEHVECLEMCQPRRKLAFLSSSVFSLESAVIRMGSGFHWCQCSVT